MNTSIPSCDVLDCAILLAVKCCNIGFCKMVQHNHKRQKQSHHPASGFTLPAGTQGFLLHCTMKRERRAADEILNLLAEYAEKQETSVPVTAGTLENDIERELSELRDKDKQLFSSIHTGIGCCVFIMVNESLTRLTVPSNQQHFCIIYYLIYSTVGSRRLGIQPVSFQYRQLALQMLQTFQQWLNP